MAMLLANPSRPQHRDVCGFLGNPLDAAPTFVLGAPMSLSGMRTQMYCPTRAVPVSLPGMVLQMHCLTQAHRPDLPCALASLLPPAVFQNLCLLALALVLENLLVLLLSAPPLALSCPCAPTFFALALSLHWPCLLSVCSLSLLLQSLQSWALIWYLV